jgi:hypothetical protein
MKKLAMNAQYNEIFSTWKKKPNLNALALAKGLQQIGDLLPFASSCYFSCTCLCTLKINWSDLLFPNQE